MDVAATDGLVVVIGQRRRDDFTTWQSTFRIHRRGCRHAATAEPIAPLLDLWGADGYAGMVADGLVVGCRICDPPLVGGAR